MHASVCSLAINRLTFFDPLFTDKHCVLAILYLHGRSSDGRRGESRRGSKILPERHKWQLSCDGSTSIRNRSVASALARIWAMRSECLLRDPFSKSLNSINNIITILRSVIENSHLPDVVILLFNICFRRLRSQYETRKGGLMGSKSCTVVLQLHFQGCSFNREYKVISLFLWQWICENLLGETASLQMI